MISIHHTGIGRRVLPAWGLVRTRCRLLVTSLFRHASNRGSNGHSTDDAPGACEISHVADPNGAGSIVALRGLLDSTAIDAVHRATLNLHSGDRLYLDLTRVSIPTGPWLRLLESVVDELEDRGIGVRVIGVDPHHPDLRRHQLGDAPTTL